jgi:hypothetical protein
VQSQPSSAAGPLSAVDRLEIRELIARYNWAIDTRDGLGVADTFTADGVFDGATIFRGRDELIGFGELRHRPPALPGVGAQHWTTNLVLDGNSQRVKARMYFIRENVDNGSVSAGVLGYYNDELVKVDGRWLFASRRFRTWPPTTDAEDGKPWR